MISRQFVRNKALAVRAKLQERIEEKRETTIEDIKTKLKEEIERRILNAAEKGFFTLKFPRDQFICCVPIVNVDETNLPRENSENYDFYPYIKEQLTEESCGFIVEETPGSLGAITIKW